MKKRKRRSVAASSAASRKAHRVRRAMQQSRVNPVVYMRAVLDDMLPPERTINRIPKVEWK